MNGPDSRAPLRVALVGLAEPEFGVLALDALLLAVRRSDRVRSRATLEVIELDVAEPEAIAARVAASAPDVVALSCYVWSAAPLLAAAALLARRDPRPIVIAGGPELAGIEAETLAREAALDAVAHGEGEETLRDALEALLSAPGDPRAALAGIPGLSARAPGGAVVPAAPRSSIADLDALPSPYLDGSYFDRRRGRLDTHCAVVAQYRGCPFQCAYCHWGSGERRLRWFGEARVVAELEAIRRAGVGEVFFADALFTIRRDRARRLLDVLARLRFRDVTVHVDPNTLDDDLVSRLAAVPGLVAHVGVQAGGAETLRHARRALVVSAASPRLRELVASGCRVRVQAIVGLPTDTPAQQRATLAPFLGPEPNVDLQLFHLQVLPGSEYWRAGPALGMRFGRAPPHFVEHGIAWGPEDLQRMKLDAWLVSLVHDRNALRFLDRLHRAWAPGAPPLVWHVADRLWAAGELRDVAHGAWRRPDPAAVRRAQEAARGVVAELAGARGPEAREQVADAFALDGAVAAVRAGTPLRRWSLVVHPARVAVPADAGLGPDDAIVRLGAGLDGLGDRGDAVVVCAGPERVHVASVERVEADRLRSGRGARALGAILDGHEATSAPARAAAPAGPLVLRLPPAAGPAACNNGCEPCLTRPAPERAGDPGPAVAGRDVLLRDREPLMRRDLPGVVAALRGRGASSIRVVTNGRLLAYRALGQDLLRAGVDGFVVKLFGCDAAAHDGRTRVPGSFEQARLGIAAARAAGAWVAVAFPGSAPGRNEGVAAASRRALARALTGRDPVELPPDAAPA